MFDVFMEHLKDTLKSRIVQASVLFLILFAILINRIFFLQIVNGDEYVQNGNYRNEGNRNIKSTRGNFYDRKGKILAYNELSYTVTLEDIGELKDNEAKNAMVYKLIRIIERHNGTIACEFYIEFDEDGIAKFKDNVDETAQLRFKRDVYSRKKVEDLTKEEVNASAQDVFNFLRYGKNKEKPSMFDISEKYNMEDTLKIMKVRYAMFLQSYQKYIPITIAMNVDIKTVSAIKENSADLPGVDILQETNRVYNDSKYFSNLLGYTGLVPQDKLKELNKKDEKKYCETDQIGKFGLEQELEDELHGKNGYETLIINSSRRVVDVKEKVEPIAGNDVYLTIDSDLQKACYDLMEKKLAGILVSKIRNNTSHGSKGTSASDITIPIYDVYFALIDNNVIDVSILNKEDSSNLEKSVYKKFLQKQKEVKASLETLLAVNSKTLNKDATDEMEEYLNYIYTKIIVKNQIIVNEKVDTTDLKYIDFKNDKISLSEFLQYAISKNWIDLSKIDIGDKFYTNEEVYKKLVSYINKSLSKDKEFNKRLYNYLIYSYTISGKDICLLLFDQGVLKYNKEEIDSLQSGNISPYNFMINKIKKLKITPGQLALEPCSGSVVVTDVKTGDVLALVSYPSYDNNKMANTADAAYFSKLAIDKAAPMINRPLQQKSAPGSTFKVVSATAGLLEGVITPYETINCTGRFTKSNYDAKCHVFPGRHGSVNVSKAIEVSCNYFFYEVGHRLSLDGNGKFVGNLGLKKLEKYAKMYGFDKETGIELPEAKPEISTQSPVHSAIGQGNHNFAPAQIARYATTVANSGTCYDLTIIDKIKNINNTIVKDNKAKVYKKVDLSDQTWDYLHTGMYGVVNSSTSALSSIFKPLEIEVAGKTGTAQESKSKPNHALFISYAPYDNPEISVTAVIPNGYTSANAASLVKNIYQYYYKKGEQKDLLKDEADMTIPSGRID